MYTKFGLFIGGAWRQATDGETVPVMSPVSETPLGDAPQAGVADTEAALAAAEEGLARWRATPPSRALTPSTPSPTKWRAAPPKRRG